MIFQQTFQLPIRFRAVSVELVVGKLFSMFVGKTVLSACIFLCNLRCSGVFFQEIKNVCVHWNEAKSHVNFSGVAWKIRCSFDSHRVSFCFPSPDLQQIMFFPTHTVLCEKKEKVFSYIIKICTKKNFNFSRLQKLCNEFMDFPSKKTRKERS